VSFFQPPTELGTRRSHLLAPQ